MTDDTCPGAQPNRRASMGRTLLALGALALSASGCTTLGISPRPARALIRLGFDKGGLAMSQALEKHVPKGVQQQLDLHYDSSDPDAFLDVFHPPAAETPATALPTIVWVHGGAWVSGDKGQVANYLRILASKGYTVVGVNYSIAPAKTYPTPLKQVNTALAYLQAHAARLRINPRQFFLAGDSAGAQIVAQLAQMVSDPPYARLLGIAPRIQRAQLRGVLLYCGAYDLGMVDYDGVAGVFLKTVLWSYAGSKDFASDPAFAPASVLRYVTPAFPPTFISAGNADPLLAQSLAMADALQRQRVAVDSLFFPEAQRPALPHEYQFKLDGEAGQAGEQALQRTVAFLRRHQ